MTVLKKFTHNKILDLLILELVLTVLVESLVVLIVEPSSSIVIVVGTIIISILIIVLICVGIRNLILQVIF